MEVTFPFTIFTNLIVLWWVAIPAKKCPIRSPPPLKTFQNVPRQVVELNPAQVLPLYLSLIAVNFRLQFLKMGAAIPAEKV